MDTIEELHEFFDKRGFSDEKLKKVAICVHRYGSALFDVYDVHVNDEQMEIISVHLYRTLLHQCKSMSMQVEDPAEDILSDVLQDFLTDSDKATGNLIAMVGKAGTIEETRHPKITELAQEIAEKQSGMSTDSFKKNRE